MPLFCYMESSERIWGLIAKIAVEEGVEIVDIELTAENGQRILRVYIDQPGGVGFAECTRFSHAIEDLLEVEGGLSGRYNLEVSSPGINRPLRTREHFEKVVGQTVFVVTREKLEGRGKYKGILKALEGDRLTIFIDGRDFVVPLSAVFKAHLVAL